MKDKFGWGLLIGVLMVLALWMFLDFVLVKSGHPYRVRYRDGQINALMGKIEYELVTHEDSTRTWEKQ